MIRLTFPGLVFVYLLVFLVAIFIAWIAYEMVRRSRENRALRHRLLCAICGLEYLDRTPTPLPRCPRCGSLNERFKLRAY
jgi:rubrerythrin